MKKRILLPFVACIFSLALTSCEIKNTTSNNDNSNLNIVSIEKTDSENGVDTYTITFSDGTTTTYTVTNGVDGKDGSSVLTGKDVPLDEIGNNGDSYINLSTWDYYLKVDGHWILTGNIKGDKGEEGEPGKDGISIISIALTSSVGNVDIYTITYSDGSTSSFTVTNGQDGSQGIQGEKGEDGHTPIITISNDGYWVIDGVKTNTRATGINGSDGLDGLSAYEIYIKYHPEYQGSEEDWINDLVNGELGQKEVHTVKFNSNGGTPVDIQYVEHGEKIIKPENVTKEGCSLDGWYYQDEKWSFVGYVVTQDMTLEAKWLQNYCNVTFKYNSDKEDENFVLKYGEQFVLPAVSRYGYTFDKWTCNGEDWDYNLDHVITATSDMVFEAHWAPKTITITFDCNGGSYNGEEIFTQTFKYGESYTLPIPNGDHEFNTWYAKIEQYYYNEIYIEIPSEGIWNFRNLDFELTLYANWDNNKIYVLLPYADHGWTGAVLTNAIDYANELNSAQSECEFIIQTSHEYQEQVGQIQNLVARADSVGGVVILPHDASIKYGIEALANAGIPFVVVDRVITDSDVINNSDYWVGDVRGNNEMIGELTAEKFLTDYSLTKDEKILVIPGDNSSVSLARNNGFQTALKDAGWTDDEITASWEQLPSTGWSRATAGQLFATWLNVAYAADNTLSDYRLIFTHDSEISMGILEELANSSSSITAEAKTAFGQQIDVIASSSGLNEMYQVIKGEHPRQAEFDVYVADVDFFDVTYPSSMIRDGFDAIINYYETGSRIENNTIFVPSEIVDASNVDSFIGF